MNSQANDYKHKAMPTLHTEGEGVVVVRIAGPQPVDDGAGLGVSGEEHLPHVGREVEHRLGAA